MALKVIKYSTNGSGQPEWIENTFEQRETTVDGSTVHWGINQTRNFADDGVGLAHANFGAKGVVQNTIPFNDARS